MARRPLPPGTWGVIKVKQLGPKRWEARARFRMADGSYARPRRTGTGKEHAVEQLKKHMATLADEIRGSQIDRDSRMAHIATLWFEDLDRAVRLDEITPKTRRSYVGWTNNWITPRVGQLTARELEKMVMTCENVVTNAEEKTSKATAKGVKAAFGQLCAFAVRHGAMTNNPVRSTSSIGSVKRKAIVALTLEQRDDLQEKLVRFAAGKLVDATGRPLGARARVWQDLPDRWRAKMATGVRVGEIVALIGDSVDTHARTVLIDHHLVQVPGEGVVRVPGRKGGPDLLLRYPEWSVDLFRRLKLASGGGPLFPNAYGGWLNPGSASEQEADALAACGYGWVTGHVVRKSVALVLKEAGLSVRQIADQLGNTEAVVEKYYLASGVTNDEQALALEGMLSVR